MYKAQKAERAHRFKIAVKISLPFIIIIAFLGYIFFKYDGINSDDVILFIILTLCHVYFTTYMIYQSFDTNVLDAVTNVFNRNEILKILKNKIKKAKADDSLVLINFKNLNDISDRYGLNFGDKILKDCVFSMISFLNEHGLKDVLIGRYNGSHFLLYVPLHQTKLKHLLTTFVKRLQRDGINELELKATFSVIKAGYSDDIKSSINFLLNEINDERIIEKDIDKFEYEICKSIDNSDFVFKIQKMANLDNEADMYSVITTLKTANFGNISKSNFINIANKNGYEIRLDMNIFSEFFTKFKSEKSFKFMIEISPVSLRNGRFLNFLKEFMNKNNIDASNIIFEFNEKEIYTHITRFNEIIKEYKKLGFSFAISHFGGKNSFFTYFLNLDIDYIVYDISFSKNYKDKKVANTFLKFNEICRSLGVKSIIKFVEKAEILEFAKVNKADFAQGFYIQKPKEI